LNVAILHRQDYEPIENGILSRKPLAIGQRVILEHDEQWTYLVTETKDIGGKIEALLQKARPISDFDVIRDTLNDTPQQ